MDSILRYHRAVAFIESITNVTESYRGIRHARPMMLLRRMRAFLELIGNPDRQFQFVHIAGTAGKGSVSTMTHEMLVASGKRVGLFTSPFTTTAAEKFRVGNSLMSPGEFADIVDELKPAIDRAYVESPYGGPSYFELCLAIALRYFEQMACEWVVCEVGCGGRYDATNVIRRPVVTAVTNIDLDHTDILGDTVTAIARDKVGIAKRGSQFFTTEQRPRLLRMFRDTCTRVGASFHAVQPLAHSSLMLRGAMRGDHQAANAALAAAIGRAIGLPERAIGVGIARARLPCRFEVMQQRPTVVLDGAHSVVKMRSVAATLDTVRYRRLILVMSVARDKNVAGILAAIVPKADHLIATRYTMKDRKCCVPVELTRMAKRHGRVGLSATIRHDAHQALDDALRLAGPQDLVLVTGSFFLTGELRARWIPEVEILEYRTSFPTMREYVRNTRDVIGVR